MNISEIFNQEGTGVIATSAADGIVNTAIYARPHIIDEKHVAWGMTEGRTHNNVVQNPHGAYIFIIQGPGYRGVRLGLKLQKIEESGSLLDSIKASTEKIVNPQAAQAVKYAAYFEIIEIRPLV